ncbi:hypothetical protein B0H11DRAFT_1877656 [Mycena galericulata]|nr:hypothetical protein B0H11DRAFT_1877656 [Mycena galericulata]
MTNGLTQELPPPSQVPDDNDRDDTQSVISLASTIVESETLTRVEHLWFEEDNLIIRAEDSLFRVSKGVLAARSPVFKGMLFGLPRPNPAHIVTMYGCPVIQLHHSAADVEYFLRAIFDSEFFLPPPAKSFFWAVVGILRLAYEYDVKYLLRRALFHFETFYPSIIDGQRVYDDPPEDSSEQDPADKPESSVNACVLVALQVASEVGALWNIPCIIYDCCTLELGAIVDLPEWDDLSPAQKRQVLVAHGKQKSGARIVSQFLLADHPEECANNDACNVAKLRWLKILDRWSSQGLDVDPLALWDETDWQDMGRDFCEECLHKYEESHATQRELVWEMLPESCGLPNWEELGEMKADMFAE